MSHKQCTREKEDRIFGGDLFKLNIFDRLSLTVLKLLTKSVKNRVIKWEDIIIFKLCTYLKTSKSHREFELSTKLKHLYFIIICVNY